MKNVVVRGLRGLLVLALTLLLHNPAYALSLNNFSGNFAAGTDHVDVTVGNDGSGNTTITVQWVAGSSGLTPLGVDHFFYDTDTDLTSCVPPTTTTGCVTSVNLGSWTTNFDGSTAGGGFGDFSSHKNQDSAGTNGISSALVFTLNGTPGFDGGNPADAADFAVHVRYGEGCSGWFSGRTAGTSDETSQCAVPEPTTMLLVGSGLVSLGVSGRKKLKKRIGA